MNISLFLGRSVFTFLALAAGSVASVGLAEEAPPNILFIFADDQCYDTINALGNEEIETPNLDRLVREGTTFTHAYNMGAWHGAVCVASRTMLNTGRYLWHARSDEGRLNQKYVANNQAWAQLLASGGYETFFTGKWHVKADVTKIFQHTSNIRGGMPNQTKEGYNRPIEGKEDVWSPYDPKFGGFWKGGKHWSEVVGDDTVGFLKQAATNDKPFFIYTAFNAPHDPRQAPKAYVDKYPADEIKIPENFLPEYPHNAEMGSGRGLRDERLAPFPRTHHAVQVNRQEYYAIITHMDDQIGRILAALKATGQAENTYIFFTADHGLAVGQHGLMGKQNMFDHSVRVPLMVVGPDVPQGEKRNGRVYLQDVMATSLELGGVDRPEHVQFQSLLPLINDKTAQGRDAIYGGYVDHQRMVTMGDWKLIAYPKSGKVLLYNISADPHELHDVAGEAKNAAVVEKLLARFEQLQRENGDKLDLRAAIK